MNPPAQPDQARAHTPGPWRVFAGTIIQADKNGEEIILCSVLEPSQFNPKNFDETRANARLIASAPDLLRQRDELLEVLKMVFSEIGTRISGQAFGEFSEHCKNKLGAAVANATKPTGE